MIILDDDTMRVGVEVTPGKYRWEIEPGPEHQRQVGELDVSAGKQAGVNVTLKRIASLRGEGWYSGDLHVHRTPFKAE